MNVRDALLLSLEKRKGAFVSGADLARDLSVSRSAVWKAAGVLAADGYPIERERALGYRLKRESDRLSAQSIYAHLPNDGFFSLDVRDSVDSTNAVVKAMGASGAPEGTVVLSLAQSAGRGRLGRRFDSPTGGLYMSLLLRPKTPASEAIFLTTAAAVAVAQAIDSVAGKRVALKWVNDVFLEDRKVCGILTEASLDVENGMLSYAVLGIGLNVTAPASGFAPEISQIAGAIFTPGEEKPESKSLLAAEILSRFRAFYGQLSARNFLPEYRARSLLLGEKISVLKPGRTIPAIALQIDDECRLVVRYEDGTVEALSSGEVSVRR